MAELTPQACRAARALLDWRLADLSEASGLSIETLTQFENGRAMRSSNREKIAAVFLAHGVEITNGDHTGARLKLKVKKAAKATSKDKRK